MVSADPKVVAKVVAPVKPAKASVSLKRAYAYFESIKEEFRKIEWTPPEEIRTYAKAVVAGTFVFGMVIYGVDIVIQRLLAVLEGGFRYLFG